MSAEEVHRPFLAEDAGDFFRAGRKSRQTRKPSDHSRWALKRRSERNVFAGYLLGLSGCGGGFRFSARESLHGIGAHTPEDGELRGLGFLRLAVFALVFRADELSVNQDMVAFVSAMDSPRRLNVVIGGGSIMELGRTGHVRLPKDVLVVNASGKFLIPGLWDMHVHERNKEVFFPLFLANGTTGVRDVFSLPLINTGWMTMTFCDKAGRRDAGRADQLS